METIGKRFNITAVQAEEDTTSQIQAEEDTTSQIQAEEDTMVPMLEELEEEASKKQNKK